ncbi:MAG: hypothetical protein K0S38_1015 [Candidatus Paceibacter sp.]|jgi:hypothetical protein|nr:hypothetical protein [Candidatus Paceibacter sp.]
MMKQSNVIFIGVLFLVILGFAIPMTMGFMMGRYIHVENENQENTIATSTVQSNSENLNFSKTGNIVRPENQQAWYLVYEEPGKPALRVELSFQNSIETSRLTIGDRVKIEGVRTGDRVDVYSITLLK